MINSMNLIELLAFVVSLTICGMVAHSIVGNSLVAYVATPLLYVASIECLVVLKRVVRRNRVGKQDEGRQ